MQEAQGERALEAKAIGPALDEWLELKAPLAAGSAIGRLLHGLLG